MVGNHKILS